MRLAREARAHTRRARQAARLQREAGLAAGGLGFDLSENLQDREPRFLRLRAAASFLSGRYHQQHAPVRQCRVPVGHAVRWGYLATAATLLAHIDGDRELLATLEAAWEHLVARRMYLTGGVGSLPVVEGFGHDFELDDDFAYCETCASLATLLWSQALLQATGKPRYADLVEWELYNGAAVGVGLDGRSYLYRNPLRSQGGLTRRPWFDTACCPSNVSRAWATLGRLVAAEAPGQVWLQQYLGSTFAAQGLDFRVESGLPWHGRIRVEVAGSGDATLHLRIPGWCRAPSLRVDGQPVDVPPAGAAVATASDLPFHRSRSVAVRRRWAGRHQVDLELPLDVHLHRPHARLASHRGKVALSRGPLVYCLESVDNHGVPDAVCDADAPVTARHDDRLGGVTVLEASDLTFVPYYAWANRGPSSMQVWAATGALHRA